MPNPDRKNEKVATEPALAMMAEMQRINDELHHLGEETLSRVNALLRADTAIDHPVHEEEKAEDQRRSA